VVFKETINLVTKGHLKEVKELMVRDKVETSSQATKDKEGWEIIKVAEAPTKVEMVLMISLAVT
jgi:hypothetical protein